MSSKIKLWRNGRGVRGVRNTGGGVKKGLWNGKGTIQSDLSFHTKKNRFRLSAKYGHVVNSKNDDKFC